MQSRRCTFFRPRTPPSRLAKRCRTAALGRKFISSCLKRWQRRITRFTPSRHSKLILVSNGLAVVWAICTREEDLRPTLKTIVMLLWHRQMANNMLHFCDETYCRRYRILLAVAGTEIVRQSRPCLPHLQRVQQLLAEIQALLHL